MLSKGAYEVGAEHYPYMIALHLAFFLSLMLEVLFFHRPLSVLFPILFLLFVVVQCIRIWCLASLGQFWNTKIIILPGANVVKKGPYKLIRHPNYFVVCLEIILLPFMFGAYFTAITFTLLNFAMLSVRIPIEEDALRKETNYTQQFKKSQQSRFN
ncbi:MAG TPA: isoprenylcysteine carboxylmethyltransferase family protein [Ureibacillus sp.]|nr:isoprenylcysteine carboxylmethyltransferase family protein [Ureibacillus sp.]